MRQNFKICIIKEFKKSEVVNPYKNENFQVNSLMLTEFLQMRKNDLNGTDFDLVHLNAAGKNKI